MSSGNYELDQLREIIFALEETMTRTNHKNAIQIEIFTDYVKIFQKHAQKLTALSNKINEQILSAQDENEESIANIYQHLSNSLLRMADCSKNVAVKGRNEVNDPLKLFVDNYQKHNKQTIQRLKLKDSILTEKYGQLAKNRQNYQLASQRLQKQRKTQAKALIRIENGDVSELEKFNSSVKKIAESIKQSEEQYINSVNLINIIFVELRSELKNTVKQFCYNEQSRIVFARKSLASSIRILEEFKVAYDGGVEKKVEDSLKKGEDQKPDSVLRKNLNTKISLLAASKYREEFVSYEQITKQKKKKINQEENPHFVEIFLKVQQDDKEIINNIISSWFKSINTKKNNLSELFLQAAKTPSLEEVDYCKEKILSYLPYSFYFIETLYMNIIDMNSFYCKLVDQDFLLLLNLFNSITSNLQLQENTPAAQIAIQFVYKMIQISMRVMWIKNSKSSKGQPIQLLCQHYGLKCKPLSNQINLKKLYLFIQKKKLKNKSTLQSESQPKTMMGMLMRGVQAVKGKKQQSLSEEESFNCLTQLTQMMANLLVSSQIAIPFIKSLLGKNDNARSLEYLKSIMLEKKDIQQRRKIFYQTEIKGKKEEEMRKIIESKKIAVFCIWQTAKRGYFDKQEIEVRIVCKDFLNIHQEILSHLNIPTQQWIRLIPLDRQLNYVLMKQQVAQNSVPSQVQQIITLDVNRSLHNHGEVLNPTVLHSLLRIYAYYHKDISYCQGMNYIAGYIYIKTKNEEYSYRIFEHLMDIRFKQLFANQFEVLKVKMYQFQRLLGIFHPQISDHFKKQGISPECYIVSWIITLFASSYQYTMNSYLIDLLWQRFIIWGWRQFFRFVLSLFNMFKQELVELTYDKALHFLGEMGRSEMFLTSSADFKTKYPQNKVQEGMDQYPITEQLLESLKIQYKLN